MKNIKDIVAEVGASKVAERMGERFPQTINNWLNRGGIPDGKVLLFCKSIDYKITPHQLRPDLYPHPSDGLPDHMREVA